MITVRLLASLAVLLAWMVPGASSSAPSRVGDPVERVASVSFVRLVARAETTGCTPYLVTDGTWLWWGGCPTSKCENEPVGNECQVTQNSNGRYSCHCNGGGSHVLCQPWFEIDEHGRVDDEWNCVGVECPNACYENDIPAGPYPGGTAEFYACDCH